MTRWFVYGHIEDTEMQLSKVEKCVIDVLCLRDAFDERLGDLLGWIFYSRAGWIGMVHLPGVGIFSREIGVVMA